MDNRLFAQPILNSLYTYPVRHWELDSEGQPTLQIIEGRRSARFITSIPKLRKSKDQGNQHGDQLGTGSQQPRFEWPLDLCRVHQCIRHGVGFQNQG